MACELTAAEYDALFGLMKVDMPQVWRDIFPTVLTQLEVTGALSLNVTESEIVVRRSRDPVKVYRVKRRPIAQ